mgnify:CR=1 FL=1
MQNILSTVGINVTRDESELLYKDYIYEDALRQLLESNRIKAVIRDFEQDLWNN